MKQRQAIQKENNKEIIDILKQEIEEDKLMKIDIADVCRLLMCRDYKTFYRPFLLSKHIDIEKEYIKLAGDRLYINSDTCLTVSEYVTFEAGITKIDNMFFVAVENFKEIVGVIHFDFKPTIGYVKHMYQEFNNQLAKGKEVNYEGHLYILRRIATKKRITVDYQHHYFVDSDWL